MKTPTPNSPNVDQRLEVAEAQVLSPDNWAEVHRLAARAEAAERALAETREQLQEEWLKRDLDTWIRKATEAERQCRELREDAERYRWLNEKGRRWTAWLGRTRADGSYEHWPVLAHDSLDAAIDAAMGATGVGTPSKSTQTPKE